MRDYIQNMQRTIIKDRQADVKISKDGANSAGKMTPGWMVNLPSRAHAQPL